MKTAARLGLYGGALALVFTTAAVVGDAVVPDHTVQAWTQAAERGDMNHSDDAAAVATNTTRGVAIAQDGYLLSPIAAPGEVGETGRLSFRIIAADGSALADYAVSHDQRLHLIVVRSDGTQFRHVHPTLAADGVWSLPWSWNAAGTYRVYADFIPADIADGTDLTLTRTVEVAGIYTPASVAAAARTSSIDGFDVTLDGELRVGSDSNLTATITRAGKPVTTLQPYLGAFGHLVVLRGGDLAYLHVHPMGEDPGEDDLSGPTVTFMSQAPTAGRYLLYLDFQVDGQVHTAPFTIDATRDVAGATADRGTSSAAPSSAEADRHGTGADDAHGR